MAKNRLVGAGGGQEEPKWKDRSENVYRLEPGGNEKCLDSAYILKV